MRAISLRRRGTARGLVASAAAAVLALGLASCGGSAGGSGGGQVVFANYGGAIGDAFKTSYWEPFTKENGTKVVSADADPARYVAMMKSGSSEWDTMDADGFAVVSYIDKGLVQKLPGDVPRSDMVDAKYRDYTAGGYTQSFVLAYNKKDFPVAPTSWADFWDTKKFPGKRGIANYYIGTAEAALLADGVRPDSLYPLDFNRAFTKLDALKSDLTISDSYAAATQALQAGSTSMTLLPNGRAAVLMQSDPDIAIMWQQNIFYPWSGFTIPKGAPNAAGMAKLLTVMQDPQNQAKFAEKTFYGPTRTEAYKLIPADVADKLPGTPEHRAEAVTVDSGKLAAQTDDYIKAFDKWVAK